MRTDASPEWFRRNFNDDYLAVYAGRTEAQADGEVESVIRHLRISERDSVLDLCCGCGRHLAAFRRRGIPAIGVDLSMSFLQRVPPCDAVGRRRVVRADMRALPFRDGAAEPDSSGGGVPAGFSVVVNFFTSFGYFASDEENSRALGEVARVLRPGGRFAVDLLNLETTVRTLERRSERFAGPFLVVEERRWDPPRRRLEKTIEIRRRGRGVSAADEGRRYIESIRLYAEEEIADLLRRAGLSVDRMLGDFSGRPFGPGTPRMIVLGSRAGRGPWIARRDGT